MSYSLGGPWSPWNWSTPCIRLAEGCCKMMSQIGILPTLTWLFPFKFTFSMICPPFMTSKKNSALQTCLNVSLMKLGVCIVLYQEKTFRIVSYTKWQSSHIIVISHTVKLWSNPWRIHNSNFSLSVILRMTNCSLSWLRSWHLARGCKLNVFRKPALTCY